MGVFDLLLQNLRTLFEIKVFFEGKVDIQKSLYFMKELGSPVPLNFRWSKLGPYSYELANIADQMTLRGYMKYTGRYEMVERGFRFIKPNVPPELDNFFKNIEKVCNQNNFDKVAFIECAASIHFLRKNSSNKEKSEVFNKLKYLKPHRANAFEPIKEESWKFLEDHSLI